ncbi:hypothetical protein [Raoultibacter massiliensis]|uniref:hypothetical protein n=1 Tax=Raoultibacter massiliensis TaxID=1852371 RepID=UPI003A9306BB
MDTKNHMIANLEKGQMAVYQNGETNLHAYRTNDPIDNEVFIVERNGRGVAIESPCFFDNNEELESYAKEHGIEIVGMLIAYHGAGATVFPGAARYSTRNADEYNHTGGGRALVDNFESAFGDAFDASIHETTDFLEEGPAIIGGIEFVIENTPDAFDIEIPALNAVYTHMLGHDCHSIVAGSDHADAMVAQLEGYLERGYDLVLTSHYTPESLKDVETKIAYLEKLKDLATRASSADEFKAQAKQSFPAYSGENYLDMTAGFFFA